MTSTDFSSLCILVVDDNVSIQELVVHKLKKLGAANIVTADNGKTALVKLRENQQPVDIIICDLNMPEMDGVQFLRHLADEAFPGGIILLSGVNQNVLRSAHRLASEHSLNILGSISKQAELKEFNTIFKEIDFKKELPEKKLHSPVSGEDLYKAIEQQQIEYVFQPKVRIATREITGVEVLTRWKHPDYGDISPEQFIQMAEHSGFIDRLTRLVCARGMEQGKRWQDKGIDIKFSVNAGADSLEKLDFADFVIELAKSNRIPSEKVVIEVTESQLMRNISAHLETLTRLQMNGIGLSIDDYGKGYSTLEQLKRIPFTELKIDRDFVTGASGDSSSMAILESTVDLARKLEIETVAEGVETADDWALVEAVGCEYAQGFYISRGLTGTEFEKWFQERGGRY